MTPSSDKADLGLLVGVAAWNVLQNNVSRRAYGALNAVGVAAVLATGRAAGLDWDDLGMGEGAVRRGLAVGGPVAGAVVAGVAVVASDPRRRRVFRDERVEREGFGELAREALFRIPVGTALFEEVLFRGLLTGWWGRRDKTRVVLIPSALFGLWHILPTLRTLHVYRSGRLRQTSARSIGSVTAAVVGSATAGAGLGWLRNRSRSVLAPVLVHAAVNVAGYLAAWWAAPER